MDASSIQVPPNLRIQVLLEHEAGQPTKEFSVRELGGNITFDAFYKRVVAISFPGDVVEIEKAIFKYNLDEMHESRWVHFDSTAGLGYALESNQSRGYVFVSAWLVKKGVAPASSPLSPAAVIGAAVAPVALVSPAKKQRSAAPASKIATEIKRSTKKPKLVSAAAGCSKISVEEKILSTLWYLHSNNISSPSRKLTGLMCGYMNVLSQGFARALTNLHKAQGLIEYPEKGSVRLTESGKRAAESLPAVPDMPQTNAGVQQRIKSALTDKEAVMFEFLLDGKEHTLKEIAAVARYSNLLSQGFTGGLKKLESFELIEKDSKKKSIWLKENTAFPFGRHRV